MNAISLLNFDQFQVRNPILDSPRSVEACRRQGINPRELIAKSTLDIKKENRNLNLDNAGWDLMMQHAEDRR